MALAFGTTLGESKVASGTSLTITTLNSAPDNTQAILVAVDYRSSGTPLVVDDAGVGNVYTLVSPTSAPNDTYIYLCPVQDITPIGTHITVSFSVSPGFKIAKAHSVTGFTGFAAADQQSKATFTTTTGVAGTLTPTQSGSYLYAAYQWTAGTTAGTLTNPIPSMTKISDTAQAATNSLSDARRASVPLIALSPSMGISGSAGAISGDGAAVNIYDAPLPPVNISLEQALQAVNRAATY